MGRSELRIDKLSLDDECVRQPYLYGKYVKACAEAKKAKDIAELDLREAEAELDSKIRKDPESYGFDTEIKETAIKALIAQDKTIKQLRRDAIDTKKEAHIVAGLESAFEQRKIMLRVLAELWIHDYYSDIEVKKERKLKVRDKIGQKRSKAE